MKEDILYSRFMEAMSRKVTHKPTLIKYLAEVLHIEKDAVYRRMRREVQFTFSEIAQISEQLGISLDAIAGMTSLIHRPSYIRIQQHHTPNGHEHQLLEGLCEQVRQIKDSPDAQVCEAGNILSKAFYLSHDQLTRFYLYLWSLSVSENGKPFDEIRLPMANIELQRALYREMKSIETTVVWDFLIFQYLVTEIKYYASLKLIEPEDVALLKEDLMTVIEETEKACVDGVFAEGGKIHLYISDINISTNYLCIRGKDYRSSMVKAFILDGAISYDYKIFEQTLNCINSFKQVSTLISVSGGKIRTAFFNKQRKIVDSL